ncbi:glutamine-hydrolyzing carbamoyl-phosphate synthase small subunit [Candidatus Tremblaya phenacola]|uniref:glutamine-hydrolyzing carbamoyl-phosphate synthase small subunit n=1 Tax=Candidatus Tremblayella phenacoccinincola TaxID=1010676 RepID=UPI00133056F5|nr:glutamine-hydrolyzing carbamoyl-phosphate synthase small subunit [Candidatus Tremblaya phenacola]KAH0998311.1 Carbamoyl-phosphate synthase small chain [Candidatus Tremblaya phenacola]
MRFVLDAVLGLEDGAVLQGRSVGAKGIITGELIFNTSITGYQEIITDPSYLGQLIVFTFPHIGNSGINNTDVESQRAYASGIIVRSFSAFQSGVRIMSSLYKKLRKTGMVALSGVNTRLLTQLLRTRGVIKGCAITSRNANQIAVDVARVSIDISTRDLAKETFNGNSVVWHSKRNCLEHKHKVIVLNFGLKFSILRCLMDRSCIVYVVSAYVNCKDILNLAVDGIVLSNGPGSPSINPDIISNVKKLIHSRIPMLGICFGHQVTSLSLGAKTKRLRFGHHGTNHPVKDLNSGAVVTTAQNHSFTIEPASLNDAFRISHISLFDESVQGLETYTYLTLSFQGHPEACAGPKDIEYLFDAFITVVNSVE